MDTITNYHEKLVFFEINNISNQRNLTLSENAILDIACIALNLIPARYVRHQVDTVFYTRDEESTKMNSAIKSVVNKAIDKVINNPR